MQKETGMAEEQEEVVEEPKKKSGGKMMLIIIIVLILILLIGGGLAAFLLLSGNDDVAPSNTQQQSTQQVKTPGQRSENLISIGPMYPMDQFVVNLLSESGSRFLKTSLDIELDSEDLAAEMDIKKSAIRDIIIRTLSSKTFEEVSTMKGKDKLKDQIVERVNAALADGQVKNIFFTDFVVQ